MGIVQFDKLCRFKASLHCANMGICASCSQSYWITFRKLQLQLRPERKMIFANPPHSLLKCWRVEMWALSSRISSLSSIHAWYLHHTGYCMSSTNGVSATISMRDVSGCITISLQGGLTDVCALTWLCCLLYFVIVCENVSYRWKEVIHNFITLIAL